MPSPRAPKNTLTGLRHLIDENIPKPSALSRKQFDKLDEAAKEEYDLTRLRWFMNGLHVNTPAIRRLTVASQTLLISHNPNTVGEHGLVLTGPPHIGKTTALVKVAGSVEAFASKWNPNYREEGVVPVVYIEMEPRATPKSIASSVLTFFAIPHNFKSATQHQLTAAAIDALQRHGTVMLIIDEVQMLKLDGQIGDDAINSLKTFMNNSGTICVFAGVDLTVGLASRAAEQIMARCQITEMRPMTGSDEATRSEWAALAGALGASMHLLDAEPDHLAPYADSLLAQSNGKIGDLRRHLGFAMQAAISERSTSGVETITADMLGLGRVVA